MQGLILAVGMALGGYLGSRIGARGGEKSAASGPDAVRGALAIRMLLGGGG